MVTFVDRMDLGYFPLQDFAAALDGTPVAARLSLAAGRVARFDTGPSNDSLMQYARENGMGTLGDVHPWSFWQTRDRAVRGMGAWSQTFASMVTDADIRYAQCVVLPVRDSNWSSDSRFADRTVAWPAVFPRAAKGSLVLAVSGTEEADQHNLAVWTDPRLVAPNVSGDGSCGTLVVDLQPSDTLCMDASNSLGPGIGGRHARLQTLTRVIAIPPSQSMAGLGGIGNVVALNYTTTGSDGIPGYGAVFAQAQGQGGSNGPITQRMGGWPDSPSGNGSGPIEQSSLGTRRGSRTVETGYGFYADRLPAGEPEIGSGFGDGLTGSTGGQEITLGQFGAFQPSRRGGHAVALMAAMPTGGPIHAGHVGDKHQLGVDRDGHPINSAHISTGAFFYRNQEMDGPMEFGGRYPYPPGFPLKSRVHLAYDSGMLHGFYGGVRQGMWRWWCEVPYFAPTTGGGNPGNPTNPNTGGPRGPTTGGGRGGPGGPGGPGSPGGGRGPTTGGPGGPSGGRSGPTTGSGRGGPSGPVAPPAAYTPRPGWRAGPERPGGPPSPRGPITPGGGPNQNAPAASPAKPGQGGPSVNPDKPKGPTTPGGGPERPSIRGLNSGPRTAPPASEKPYRNGWRPQDKLVTYPDASPRLRRKWAREFIESKQPTVLSWELGDPDPGNNPPGPITPARTPGPTTGPRTRRPEVGSCRWAENILQGNPNQSTASNTGQMGGPSGSFYNPANGVAGRTVFGDQRMEMGRLSGMDPWTWETEEVPGVVERVGTVDREQSGLYAIFNPLMTTFAGVGFRPQLHVANYPHFLHNPQIPAIAIERDEALRPSTLSMFAFGGQSDATGDYRYVEDADLSRVRGGTANGGVVFTPPRFGLEDYYGVGTARNVDVTTGQGATTSYVMAAPGVCFALGKPNPDGSLKPQAVTMAQDATTALDIRHDGAQLFKGSKSGSTVIVELGQGGNSAVKLPYGTNAQRPTGATGLVRVSTQTATHALEFWNGTAWVQPSGGGGLPTLSECTVLGRYCGSGTGTAEELLIGQNLYTYTLTTGPLAGIKQIGAMDQEIVDGNYGDIDVTGSGATWSIVEGDYIIGAHWLFKECHNNSGSTITKGTPVYITGRTGDKINIAPADASNSAKMPCVGIVKDTVTNTSDGIVIVGGEAKLIDVGAAAVGDTLYVASGGGFTTTKPIYPNLVQNIGKVTKEGTSGTILVFGPGRTNDVPQLDNRYIFQGNVSGSTVATKTPTLDALTLDAVANTTALTISGYSLTGANAQPAVNITGTWNTTGNPTAIKLDVTNTASGANALLLDLQVGAVSQCKVAKNGQLTANRLTSTGIIENAAGIYADNFSVRTQNAGYFGFSSTGSPFGAADILLYRDGAGILAQRNTTNTQAFRVYRTWTDASNYEAVELAHATYSGGQYSILRTITAGTGADNINLVLSPSGTGAIMAQLADGLGTGGNARGNNAVDLQTDRLGVADRVASGRASFVVGRGNQAAGDYSVGLGYDCRATGSNTIAQGLSSQAAASYSFARGVYANPYLYAGYTQASGRFATTGDAQITTLVARQATTDAIPTELFLDGTALRLQLGSNTRWLATVRVVASTSTAGAQWAVFERRCLISRGASNATTAINGNVVTVNSDSGTNSGSPPTGWAFTLAADTTNGSLKLEATGVAATTIRWVAQIDLVEVAFA